MPLESIKTRDGDLAYFDRTKIERAIEKAAEAVNYKDLSFVESVTDEVIKRLKKISDTEERFIAIEEIQDILEEELMKAGIFPVLKEFIIYRNEKNEERSKLKVKADKKLEKKTLKIVKANGEKQNFDIKKIKKTYKRVNYQLARQCKFEDLEESLKKYIVEGMKTSDILSMMIKASTDMVTIENTAWEFIAGRLLMLDLYKKASNTRGVSIKDLYKSSNYISLMDEYIENGLYYKDYYKYYSKEDIKKAGKYLNADRDFEYNHTTVTMYAKRYLLNPNKVIKELPQQMYMSAALFLAIPEGDETRLQVALDIYDACSTGKISLPTPTLLNARTNYQQLSSCFKINIDDDLRSIYHCVENMAQISKFGGGIGVYLGNIRSKGGSIRGIEGVAGGVNPWIKVINDTAIAVNQLGARMGSISVTLDVFHRDIFNFLELQTETGDVRQKAYDVFPSVSFPDLFMKRMEAGKEWTLLDPHQVEKITGKKIQDCFGDEFEEFYEKCEKDSRLTLNETVDAKDLFKKYMKTTVETGMPYAFFRDTVNKMNPNKHAGNIYSTQLCVEICQNTSPSKFIEEEIEDGKVVIKYEPGDTVVCNLASVNVAKVNTKEEMDSIFPTCMRILDNVITLNFYPIKEAELTAKKYRSVGVGFLGLAEYLAVNKLVYDSQEARDATDVLFEKYAYHTLKASNMLAKERGVYDVYQGSERQKGVFMGKDAAWFENNSNMADEWKELLKQVDKDGVRFGYHLAPAPNTSTSLIVGTTASILPIYKKYFVETNAVSPVIKVAPSLNEENFWYYKEYTKMDMKDVIDMMSVVYKWMDQSISFEWMIDPSKISPEDLYNYYIRAWSKGIKTIYYMRSLSLEVKESCESCSG